MLTVEVITLRRIKRWRRSKMLKRPSVRSSLASEFLQTFTLLLIILATFRLWQQWHLNSLLNRCLLIKITCTYIALARAPPCCWHYRGDNKHNRNILRHHFLTDSRWRNNFFLVQALVVHFSSTLYLELFLPRFHKRREVFHLLYRTLYFACFRFLLFEDALSRQSDIKRRWTAFLIDDLWLTHRFMLYGLKTNVESTTSSPNES